MALIKRWRAAKDLGMGKQPVSEGKPIFVQD
jgi:hypothetical protein